MTQLHCAPGERLTIALCVILALAMTACAFVGDQEGVKIGDPKRFAEATHIARLSDEAVQATSTAVALQTTRTADEISAQATRVAADVRAHATADAITHDRQQAEADKVRAEATVALSHALSEVQAQPAEAQGKSALYLLGWIGLGVGALVLAIGVAFAMVAWLGKRATVIYPNQRGQFPLIPERGPGYTVYHDPNRALGPGVVVHRPGLIERAAYALALASGKAQPLEPGADYPQTAGEPAMLQIAVGAQAVQDQVARQSGRPRLLFGFLPIGGNPAPGQHAPARGRMPKIAVINDPGEIERFEQRLLEGGDES